MTTGLDMQAYFDRIGYTGDVAPTLDTLRGLVAAHTASIPFENLNPLLRWPVRLDLGSLQKKIVVQQRGGYCFEQNLLFAAVLCDCGFQITQLAARVMWNAPPGTVTPRSHMLLRVDVENQSYLVDVGFGGLTLTGILRLQPEIEQSTPHEPFRLLEIGHEYVMQAKLGDQWASLYRFDLQVQQQVDYEVSNWHLCNHPQSLFRSGLLAARPDPGRRYALRNNVLTVHRLTGESDSRTLRTAAEIREVLSDIFRLKLPSSPELNAALQRLAQVAGV